MDQSASLKTFETFYYTAMGHLVTVWTNCCENTLCQFHWEHNTRDATIQTDKLNKSATESVVFYWESQVLRHQPLKRNYQRNVVIHTICCHPVFLYSLTLTFGIVPATWAAVQDTWEQQVDLKHSAASLETEKQEVMQINGSRSQRHSREFVVAVVLWKQQRQQRRRAALWPSRLSLAPINHKKASCCSISQRRDENRTAAWLRHTDLLVVSCVSGRNRVLRT